MDNSQNYKRERLKVRAWQSASARIAIIYGLFALYSAILIPFIPINGGATFISDTKNAGFIFAILTSFACIMLGILVIAKLRKFGNGAIFTLHNVFGFFLLGFSALTVLVRIVEDGEIYEVLYYYAIFTDIAFGLGLLFIQIAQILNPRLRCCKGKTFYYLFSILSSLLVALFAFMTDEMIEEGYFDYMNAGEEYNVFLKLIYLIAGVYAFFTWYRVSLPVNDFMEPFGGKFYRKHTATSKVNVYANIAFAVFLLIESVYFTLIQCYIFLYAMIIGLALTIGSIVWGVLYNVNYDKKLQVEFQLKREKEEFERLKKEEREKREREETEAQEIKRVANSSASSATVRKAEPEKAVRVYDADSDRFLISANAMLKQNAFVSDPYSLGIKDFIGAFSWKLKADNVVLSKEDAVSFVASFASARVIFVSGVDKSAIKPVMEALSDAFGTDIFVQKYYEKFRYLPEYEYVLAEEPPITPAENVTENVTESAKAENTTESAPEKAEPAGNGYINTDAAIGVDKSAENGYINTDLVTGEVKPAEPAEPAEPVPTPVPEPAAMPKPEPVYIKKEKPFVKDANVIKENKRHGIVSGIFTANCLTHVIGTLFFDFTESEVTDNHIALLRAISDKKDSLKVGRHDYLQRTDFYYDDEIAIPDNLWAVCFLSDEKYKDAANVFGLTHAGYVHLSPTLIESRRGENETTGGEENFADACLSYECITDNLEKVEEDNYVSEETWAKIDKFVSEIKLDSEKAFDNRFLRQMETYSSVQKALGRSDGEILDMLLAYRILPYLSSCGGAFNDVNLQEVLDKIIGIDNLPLSQKAIKNLGLNEIRSKTDVE